MTRTKMTDDLRATAGQTPAALDSRPGRDGEPSSHVCPGCGSSLQERLSKATRYPSERISTAIRECPHCGAGKCCMCDMGNDVECPSCPDDENE